MTRHVGSLSRSFALVLAFAAVALGSTGCQPPLDEVEQFRRGVPRQETLQAEVPNREGRAQSLVVGELSQALKGLPAELHGLTFTVTRTLNGAAGFVGALVGAVVRFPPTTISTDEAVWGPWNDDLDPIVWKVTITRVGEHKFQYRFEARAKADPGGSFVSVLAGTHTASADGAGNPIEGHGAGSFTLDWDARNTLPALKEKEVGKAHYTYSRQPGAVATIDARFQQVRDDKTGKLADADYAFARNVGGGGTMDFTHALAPQAGMAGARWAVRSRWLKTGAGRADVQATISDLPTPLTGSECWDQLFLSTYKKLAWTPLVTYGTEATDCVFPTAEFSRL